jgi:uncharacterized protein (DUF3820 family)
MIDPSDDRVAEMGKYIQRVYADQPGVYLAFSARVEKAQQEGMGIDLCEVFEQSKTLGQNNNSLVKSGIYD